MGLVKKAKKKTEKEKDISYAKAIGAAMGGHLLAGGVAQPTAYFALNAVTKQRPNITDEEMRALAKEMGAPNIRFEEKPNYRNASFLPGEGEHGTIRYDPKYKNRGTIAHELGHATGFVGSNPPIGHAGKKAWLGLYNVGKRGGALGATGGIASARAIYKKKHNGEENRALQAADYLGRAGTAAMLTEEGQASLRGLRAIAKKYGIKAALKASPELAVAFGTYGGIAGINHKLMPYLAERSAERQLAEKS